MKKQIFAFLLLACFSLHVHAQYHEGELQGKTWFAQSGYATSDQISWYFSFTSGKAYFDFKDKKSGKTVTQFVYDMYLSASVPTVFDTSRVSQNQSGRYLVMCQERIVKGETKQIMHIAEILSLTAEELVIKYAGNTVSFHAQ